MKKILLMVCFAGVAFSGDPGRTENLILRLGGGARSYALGGAFVALSDDVSGIYWNPAGVLNVKNMELMSCYMKWFVDTNYAQLAFCKKLGDYNIFGISLNYFYAVMENIDESGVGGESFIASDSVMILSYGREFTPYLFFGMSLKGVHKIIQSYKKSAVVGDISTLYLISDYVRLGAIFQNLGEGVQPMDFKIGIGYKGSLNRFLSFFGYKPFEISEGYPGMGVRRVIEEVDFLIDFDVNLSLDSNPYAAIGVEYWPYPIFCVRFGGNSRGRMFNPAGGIGLSYGGFCFDLSVAYHMHLGLTGNIGLLVRWGVY